MASEVALNVPFDAGEIVHIISEELQARMRGLSPLQGNKEYAAFSVDFQVKIKLRRTGEQPHEGRETLAWGTAHSSNAGEVFPAEEMTAAEENSHFDSKDPNEERVARDMPLHVETSDGRGGRIRKKVRVKA